MQEPWSLTTYRPAGAMTDSLAAAVRRADGTLVVPEVLSGYAGLAAVLEDWDAVAPQLRNLDVHGLAAVDGEELMPIRFPRKILCVGANYRDHLEEMGVDSVPEGWQPFFFLIPPTTTLIGDGDEVLIPADPSYRVDWEAELAVVIGRGGRDIEVDDALDHVAGYACFNDITARSLLRREVAIAPPFGFDWSTSKGLDTFAPMGAMAPSWLVDDPSALEVRCIVNGEVKQNGTTANMITGIAEVIAAASSHWTLEPGDIIATGTPAGTGVGRGEQLKDGDLVEVEIPGFAPLRNVVRARAPRTKFQATNYSISSPSIG
jgi:2-keto-4-pentenoate hydratase/2-oxohepta-3-ene-1,7-dioic acid hydratase in catechol pathway